MKRKKGLIAVIAASVMIVLAFAGYNIYRSVSAEAPSDRVAAEEEPEMLPVLETEEMWSSANHIYEYETQELYAKRDDNQIYGVVYIPQDAGGQLPAVIYAHGYCKDIEICKHDADMAVLAAVKKEAELYLDQDKLSRQVAKRNASLSVSDRINAIVKSMEAAQKGCFALYDRYADGKLKREFFLNEKKKYDVDMERMEEELAALKQTQEAEKNMQGGSKRKAEQAVAFLGEEELTEDMKEKLIEKVVVYPGNRIEIVWRFENEVYIIEIII